VQPLGVTVVVPRRWTIPLMAENLSDTLGRKQNGEANIDVPKYFKRISKRFWKNFRFLYSPCSIVQIKITKEGLHSLDTYHSSKFGNCLLPWDKWRVRARNGRWLRFYGIRLNRVQSYCRDERIESRSKFPRAYLPVLAAIWINGSKIKCFLVWFYVSNELSYQAKLVARESQDF